MAAHAQLKFVMTECSKTQIRLMGLILLLILIMKIIIIQIVIMVVNLSRATRNRVLCSAAKARYSLEFLDIEFIGVALS